jgi:hypothetical protein
MVLAVATSAASCCAESCSAANEGRERAKDGDEDQNDAFHGNLLVKYERGACAHL